MSRIAVFAVSTAIVLAVTAAGAGALYWMSRPTVLRVGISSGDRVDAAIFVDAAKQLDTRRSPIRLMVVDTLQPGTTLQALDKGTVDIAVARSDAPSPASARIVLKLRDDAAVMIATTKSGIKEPGNLAGHRLAIARDVPGAGEVLASLRAYFGFSEASVGISYVGIDEIPALLKDGKADAALLFGPASSRAVARTVIASYKALGGRMHFVTGDEADAIAALHPGMDSTKIAQGAFSGKPVLPPDDVDTVGYAVRLYATDRLDESVVATLVRRMLAMRSSLASAHSSAADMAPPDPDDDSALVLHAGVRAYLDNDDTSLIERYSDYFYLGASLVSGVVSIFAVTFGMLAGRRRRQSLATLLRVQDISARMPKATTLEELSEIDNEASELAREAFSKAAEGELRADDIAAFGLALTDLRSSLATKRALIRAQMQAAQAQAVQSPPVPAAP